MKDMISVIVPIYNVDKYLSHCIESLIDQDYENYEIILVNDGSTDNSLQICQQYAKNDKRIKFFTQENQGVSVARNVGIKNAIGKWICFVDGDDYLSSNALSLLSNEVSRQECDILITAPIMEYDSVSISSPIFENDFIFDNSNKQILINNIICRQYNSDFKTNIGAGGPWGKLYNKEFLEKNNLEFIVGLKRMQDVIFNIYAATCATKVIYKNEYVYHYRINEGSSTVKYNPNIFEIFNSVIEIMLNYCKDVNPEYYQCVYMKTILMYIEGARIGIVNINNNSSGKSQIRQLKEMYTKDNFYNSFKMVKLSNLNIKLKIFVICTRLRLFFFVYQMIKIFINSKHKEQN